MKNWFSFLICALLGLALLGCGLLIPAHLRAVNDTVLERAAGQGPSIIARGSALAFERNFGAAQLIFQAAHERRIPKREPLQRALLELGRQEPLLRKHGFIDAGFVGELVQRSSSTARPPGVVEPFAEFLVRAENRTAALEGLERSGSAFSAQLLRFRAVTNTALFPPSGSAAGQALDTALALAGLLADSGRLHPALSQSLAQLAVQANSGRGSAAFEQALMDLLSLAQRMNFGQLIVFVGEVREPETLRLLANHIRTTEPAMAIIFAAVHVSANPAGVARYLSTFGKTGAADLGRSLQYGGAGLNELVERNQRLNIAQFHPLLPDLGLRAPWAAMTVKWLLFFVGGILIAVALHFALPRPGSLERPLQVRGFYMARAVLFGLGSLLVLLLVSEPYLAQESQKVEFPLRVQLPGLGAVAPAIQPATVVKSLMNPEVLITMLIFFVLQALLYVACLVKIAEIRRQKVDARMKLKLLENEEHLFDSGLYLGFLGTIISLILVSLGVFKQPSLMAAYSATSFGILFVVLFKVVHLRPTRRKLLLEAESQQRSHPAPNPFAATL